jgi:hypothetical protein
VELLNGDPQGQNGIIQSLEFQKLPAAEQARILRLMATQAVDKHTYSTFINEWLKKSNQLDPYDRKSSMLKGLYQVSPSLYWFFLRTRALIAGKNRRDSSIQEVLLPQK